MALFTHPKLPPDLAAIVGRVRVLASGRSPEGPVYGLIGSLVFRGAASWEQLHWHEVARGGWDRDTRRLSWTKVSTEQGELELTETGRLPQLFNERVSASIVCTEAVPLAPSGTAVISARRNLDAPDAPLTWQVSPGTDTAAEQLAANPTLTMELARLRAEYDRG